MESRQRSGVSNGRALALTALLFLVNWSGVAAHKSHFNFARRIIAFRRTHPALRPGDYFDAKDHNANGLKDVTWYRDDANEPDNAYWIATDRHFIAYRIDGTEFADPAHSIYVGWNGWKDPVAITLPTPSQGRAWHRAGDTAAWMEPQDNFKEAGQEDRLDGRAYEMKGRSLLILIEK